MLATDHSVIKDVASFFPQLSHYSITLYRVSSAFVIVLGWRRGRSSARDGISSRSKPVKTTAQLTERWKDLCGTAPNDDEKQGEDVRLSVCTRREKIPHTFSHRRIGSWKEKEEEEVDGEKIYLYCPSSRQRRCITRQRRRAFSYFLFCAYIAVINNCVQVFFLLFSPLLPSLFVFSRNFKSTFASLIYIEKRSKWKTNKQ